MVDVCNHKTDLELSGVTTGASIEYQFRTLEAIDTTAGRIVVAGTGKIAIAVLVAHEKYIGLRAAYYARLAIKRYFSDYFFNDRSGSAGKTAGAGVS